MIDVQPRYRCPECDTAILNRKIDHCLYCGASLPSEFLLSSEKIAELDERQRALEEKNRRVQSTKTEDSSSGIDWGDVIDIAIDVGGLFD